jgi:hypothetical protein
VDGTFGICSPQFYQFLTPHYFPVNSCQPAIHCLLKKRIIRFMEEKAADIRVGDVMSDFEPGLLLALMNGSPPLSRQTSCTFRHSNAVSKRVKANLASSHHYCFYPFQQGVE